MTGQIYIYEGAGFLAANPVGWSYTNDTTGEAIEISDAPPAVEPPRRTFWDWVNEPFAETQKQVGRWWDTSRRR